jgi:hypothetical protein
MNEAHSDIEFLRRDAGIFNRLVASPAFNNPGAPEIKVSLRNAAATEAKKVLVCNPAAFLVMYQGDAERIISQVRTTCHQHGLQV